MSNPAHPVQTATLTELADALAARVAQPQPEARAARRGDRQPVDLPRARLDLRRAQGLPPPGAAVDGPVARLGHESGFSADGKTFYATGTALQSITAVDVTNPKEPHAVWQGNVVSHGMTLSDDGNRAYIADPAGNMLILDVSQIQARKPNPQAREVSRLTWHAASIPQNAIPFTDHGHPYVLEFDEYTQGTTGVGDPNMVGAARIIDIADETRAARDRQPAAADQPAGRPRGRERRPRRAEPRRRATRPTTAASPAEVDPTVVACSFIASGLRVFDITRPRCTRRRSRYYVAPTQPRAENGFMASDFAMSKPAIVPARREVWYTRRRDRLLRPARGGERLAGRRTGGRRLAPARRAASRSARRIRHQGIGKVRLGMTRKALLAPAAGAAAQDRSARGAGACAAAARSPRCSPSAGGWRS